MSNLYYAVNNSISISGIMLNKTISDTFEHFNGSEKIVYKALKKGRLPYLNKFIDILTTIFIIFKDIYTFVNKQPQTVCGYTFKSDSDLSRQLGRHVNYVGRLRQKGLTYEEIISRAIA